MAKLTRFKSEEQELIKFAPIWVFLLVSKVDGKMDDKEYKQFKKDLHELSTHLNEELTGNSLDTELIHEIFFAVNSEFETLSIQITNYPRPPMDGLKKVNDLIEGLFNKGELELFKKILISIAYNVADSSGSRWDFLSRNISKIEMSIINEIKAVFKV